MNATQKAAKTIKPLAPIVEKRVKILSPVSEADVRSFDALRPVIRIVR